MTSGFLPREHGFWTMLAAVVLAALLRGGLSTVTLLTALGVIVIAGALGGVFRRAVRRNEALQLGSATMMGLTGVPIELAGKVELTSTLLTTLTWSVVFSASALYVRSSFAEASLKHRSKAKALLLGAIAVPLFAASLFAATGHVAQAVAASVAALGCTALALARLGVKRLRAVGLSLAGMALLCALALACL